MADRRAAPTGHPAGSEPEPASTEDVDALVEEAEEALEADLEELVETDPVAAERDDYLDRLKHVQAYFANYRKRMIKQQV